MNAERVPRNGRADVAFAGAQLGDAWLLILSIFAAVLFGSLFGWLAYIGIPIGGYFLTKFYIDWKSKNLPGHFQTLLYRWGLAGYSSAFDTKKKAFIGDGKIVNPSALQVVAIIRADARSQEFELGEVAEAAADYAESASVEDGETEVLN
jgi:hypothetical protein